MDTYWKNVNKKGPNECWEWLGQKDPRGYGKMTVRAHRLSWILHNGVMIPEGNYILHSCDNKSCVNPAHLNPGTAQQNIQEAIDHGLLVRGTDNPASKLTEEDVRNIRNSSKNKTQLAKEYGVHVATIRSIICRDTWRHIP